MCIKIFKSKEMFHYDATKPLEEQVKGSNKIEVNYEPQDPSIDKFLDEVERLCKNGVSANLNIKFNRASITKTKDELAKLVVAAHKEADKKLEELVNYCMERNRVK